MAFLSAVTLGVPGNADCLVPVSYTHLQETVKIYQQGKKYYDALKAVNNRCV